MVAKDSSVVQLAKRAVELNIPKDELVTIAFIEKEDIEKD